MTMDVFLVNKLSRGYRLAIGGAQIQNCLLL